MSLTLLHATWTPISLLLFVLIARPAHNPFLDCAVAVRAAIAARGGRLVLAALLGVLAANFAECAVDPAVSAALGWDATPLVRAVESDWVERVQAGVPPWSLGVLAWFYLSGYVAVLAAPLVVWTAEGRGPAVAAYTAAFAANYLLALPFYLLVPVREAAWSGLSAAQPLLDVPWPGITAELRAGSALDNCFPSLHVSCTTTVFCLALRHGPRNLRLLAAAAALATAWAVMALGIHWGLDVAAGVPFGIGCALLGRRATRELRS
ncbi:MAG: phosphatase PAP2 family protein [Planctomycetota bacterium]